MDRDYRKLARTKAQWTARIKTGTCCKRWLYGVDPAMLAAIGVRETGFQNSVQPGPFQANKTGIGIFQITNGSVPWVNSLTPMWAASYAASQLSSNIFTLAAAFPNFTSTQLLQATAASYNFGTPTISGNPATIDVGTTGVIWQ